MSNVATRRLVIDMATSIGFHVVDRGYNSRAQSIVITAGEREHVFPVPEGLMSRGHVRLNWRRRLQARLNRIYQESVR